MRSAILFKIFARSATDVFPQASCAAFPASTAASTSSFVDLAISQNTFPVTGLTFSKYFPFAGALYSPLIKLSYRSLKFRSEEHTSELQSRGHLVCRLLLAKKNI